VMFIWGGKKIVYKAQNEELSWGRQEQPDRV